MRTLPIILVAISLVTGGLFPLAGARADERPNDPDHVHKAHAIAMHGEPKYGPDFTHFDYLNPDAPKGGFVRLSSPGTFDSFNRYIPKGTAAGIGYQTLMYEGDDEAFTLYGLIAESVEWPEDRSWIIFNLRPEARWHDGVPITADDVIYSLATLKEKGIPQYRLYYHNVTAAEKLGPRRVKFTFSGGVNRELPLIMGQLPVMPKHYWEAEGRDFSQTTLEPPLTSGPYRIGDFEAGRFIELKRVEDYWGKDLPVSRGRDNFDRIRIDFYRDETVTREALKAGDIDIFIEYSAKDWALTYDIAALHDGSLVKKKFEDHSSGGMQAYFINTRRAKFQDRRLRRALAYVYDFKWLNKNIYYGLYEQPNSYFYGTELAASGLPTGEELKILERFRGRVPEEVFTTPYSMPETDGSGFSRANLKKAFELLAEAGWEVRDLRLTNVATGEPMSLEILAHQQSLERAVLPFIRNLKRLGIDARLTVVDTSQYINRLRDYDFDMIISGSRQSLSPGNEQREYWGSMAADQPDSRNLAGIKDPVVDELIDLVISAPDRESLVARTRALDRVLLWGHYTIPNLARPFTPYVYWDMFGMPEKTPLRGTSSSFWWVDPAKAEAVGTRRRARN